QPDGAAFPARARRRQAGSARPWRRRDAAPCRIGGKEGTSGLRLFRVSRKRAPIIAEDVMRPLRYSINVTLDGCCDHLAVTPDQELHRHAAEGIAQADALLLGRVTYEMMEAAWREPAETGALSDWMEPWM